ncbi:ATP-binding cassette domain-containing protein [Candidatus Dojkabacteria bacterium]|nr:ATP-binding cassette domain-containing protein [Candidatus Dojkabacteria bacterium]
MTIVDVQNVSIKYSTREVLERVNLDINSGEIAFFLGKNGSGKSTLVQTILGMHENYHGSIELFGQPRNDEIISERVGYVPQYSRVDRDFPITVSEIMQLSCRKHAKCSVSAVGHLKYLDSESLIDKSVSQLSGGQFQRVLIARSLVNDPDLLLLDEPFNNLDYETRKRLENLIVKLNLEKGMTIVIVEHDNSLIDKLTKNTANNKDEFEDLKIRKFRFDNKTVMEEKT